MSLAAIISLFLQSCIKETDVELTTLLQEPKLVVYGVLDPSSDSVKVMVTKTFPVNTDQGIDISDLLVDATVFLMNGEKTNTAEMILINEDEHVYGCNQLELDIIPGETYYLSVNAEGFEEVTAETTIPEVAAEWKETRLIESKVDMDGYYIDGYSFYGTWQQNICDNRQFVSEYSLVGRYNESNNYIERSDSKLYIDFKENNSDYIFESWPFHIYKQEETEPGSWFQVKRSMTLISADQHLYDYISYHLLIESINDVMDGGSFLDLFRGITPEFSNIEGGLGVFGSYLTDTAIIYKLTTNGERRTTKD